MCVVSMVGDHFGKSIPDRWPWVQPQTPFQFPPTAPSQEEFDALRRQVEDMKELLRKAKIYDEKNGEPDCQMDEKMKKLKDIAKIVGVDLDDVLKKQSYPAVEGQAG